MNTKQRGIIAVIGGFFIHFILGTIYLWGNVNVYVRSYFCWNGYSPDDDVSQCTLKESIVGIIFPIMFQAQGITYNFGVILSKKLGVIPFYITLAILMPTSIFLSSYMTNFWAFVVLYGVNFGAIGGLLYMVPFNITYQYFPEKKGMLSGIISSGFGVGSLTFSFIAYALVNPNNIPSDPDTGMMPKDVADNWPFAVRVLAVLYFFTLLTGGLLNLPPRKEDLEYVEEQQRLKEQSSISQEGIETQEQSEEDKQKLIDDEDEYSHVKDECPDIKSGLVQPKLYILIGQIWTLGCLGTLLSSNYKPYGQQFPALNDDGFLTWTGNIGQIANSFSRMFWGMMMDRMNFKFIIVIMASIQLCIVSTITFITFSKALYMIWVLLNFFSYGGLYAVFATQTTKMFGRNIGLQIVGVAFQGFMLACWTEFLMVETVVDEANKKHDFNMVFHIYIMQPILAIIMVLTINYKIDWKSYIIKKLKFQENSLKQIEAV